MTDQVQKSETGSADIQTVLQNYSQAWRQLSAEGIAACWEPDRFIFYKAEEIESIFHDWQQVLTYWRNNESLHKALSLGFSDLQQKKLSDDLIVATVRMRWDIRFADDANLAGAVFPHRGKAMGGDNHVVIFLCATQNGWKICGWSETPDAPLTYMRSLYLNNANTSLLDAL